MINKSEILCILLLIILLATILFLFLNFYIYYWLILVCILLATIGITLFLFDFITRKYNTKTLNKIISYFLIGCIVFIAKNPWCYILAIIILVFNANLIDNHYEKFIKDCLLANQGVVNASNEEIILKDDEERLENQNDNNVNNDDNSKPSLEDAPWKTYLKSGVLTYNIVGDTAIKYLSTQLGINFETNKKLNGKLKPLYPDGFIRLPNMDYLIEVKTARSISVNRILDNSVKAIKNYKEFYIDNLPKICATFHLLLVVDNSFNKNKQEEFQKKFFNIFKSDNYNYNYKVSFINIENLH